MSLSFSENVLDMIDLFSYIFPHYLLSHHFWTKEQREEFWQKETTNRLVHLQPVLVHLTHRAHHLSDPVQEIKLVNVTRKVS